MSSLLSSSSFRSVGDSEKKAISDPEAKPEDLDKVLKYEIGKVFETVLTHAGVYKRTPEGMAAFDRFMQVVTK